MTAATTTATVFALPRLVDRNSPAGDLFEIQAFDGLLPGLLIGVSGFAYTRGLAALWL